MEGRLASDPPPRRLGTRQSTIPVRHYPLILGNNLVGVVRGTLHPDRYIVVSAHYDHLGMRDGEIYHGADDNASGSAAILAIAEWTVAHALLNSVIFAWFDAEEEGLLGSAEFVDTVATLGLVRVRQGHEGARGDTLSDLTDRSDQGSFKHKKIPFVLINNDEHADYHRSTDDALRIDPEFFYRSAQTAAAFLRVLDGSLDQVALVRRGHNLTGNGRRVYERRRATGEGLRTATGDG
jgi:Zn-dependent M28 family amino/carboxypeptidase